MKKLIYTMLVPGMLLLFSCQSNGVSEIDSGIKNISNCCKKLSSSNSEISSDEEEVEDDEFFFPAYLWDTKMILSD